MKTVKDAEIFCQYIAHEYLGKRNYKLLDVYKRQEVIRSQTFDDLVYYDIGSKY